MSGEMENFIVGKFQGPTKGCRWMGKLVGTLTIIDGTEQIQWNWELLAASKEPILKRDLEPMYQSELNNRRRG